MNERHIALIAKEISLTTKQVAATAQLIAEGGTVPFIARYRKEMTGSLDEVAIQTIRDRLVQLEELDKRRDAIVTSLTERELLTDELAKAIFLAETMAQLEDIYLPFRPKRRTRATIAREKGLEPLADLIMAQADGTDPIAEAEKFVDAEKGVESSADALQGARDIIAERISEDKEVRSALRSLFARDGIISSKVVKDKEIEGAKFKDYFDWHESIAKTAGHRALAMFRGEKEGFLRLVLRPPQESAIEILEKRIITKSNACAREMKLAVLDSYDRMLELSMETELRAETKKRCDLEAISVFATNLRELLMASPLGQKRMMAIDPGFRTGCKVVCLDAQGKLLYNTVIHPTMSEKMVGESKAIVCALADRFKIEAIAIGNGTASRETEAFIRSLGLPKEIDVVMVNESGASIYSASEIAREEFPDEDITVRGSVSIGRRLMDPLAELVKIDPKSIGVGQYQHDVNQSQLKLSLDDVIISCVNKVGVELNTASRHLLAYVSGLGTSLAKGIEEYRNKNGAFKTRDEIKKVPRLGAKAFEQAAGFLRIRNSIHPLDASAVHPERYPLVEKMASDIGCTVQELMSNAEMRKKIDLKKYVTAEIGMPTITDIMEELAKPGRDPRESFEAFAFGNVHAIDDLKAGMKLPGIVTNVTNFGAFVDVGVHQDGLVHISELSDTFVKNPMDAVKVGQKVAVTVISIDRERSRIALSMKTERKGDEVQIGDGTAPRRHKKSPPPPQKTQLGTMADLMMKAMGSK